MKIFKSVIIIKTAIKHFKGYKFKSEWNQNEG